MGVSAPPQKLIPPYHVSAHRIMSLPSVDLLKDPLAPVKSTQANIKGPLAPRSSLHGVFQERLSGPLAALGKPPPSPQLPVNGYTSTLIKSPKMSRKVGRPSKSGRKTGLSTSFVLPNKSNLQVKEAYRRVSSDGSWSGDLIRLSSALDQLAALCHKTPQGNAGGLPRSPDPLEKNTYFHGPVNNNNNSEIVEEEMENGFVAGNGEDYSDFQSLPQHPHQNNAFKANNFNGNPGGQFLAYPYFLNGLEREPFLVYDSFPHETNAAYPPRDQQPLHEKPSAGISKPPVVPTSSKCSQQQRLSPRMGVTRKMAVILRALADRLVSWKKGEGNGSNASPIHGTLMSTSSSPITDRPEVQSTPSPSPAQTNGTMMPRKVVVALYDYNAAQVGDLCLRKNEEYEILDDSEEHWWQMRDNQGREGYAPSNYVREKGSLGLQQYDWYLGDASRQRAEAILMREEKEGCFVVRNSTTNSGIYTLSVFSKMSRVQVKHYHIKTDPDGMFYLSNSIKCPSIPELIYRHQYNPGGLCTRLRNPPSQGRQAPTTAGLSHDKWEIVPSELELLEELGSGQFGVVRHGRLYGMDVAVKMMKEGTMSEDEFIEEAKVMTKLQHPNLVQLYGVCRRKRPIYIVTEYLKHGSLLNYLRNKEKGLIQKTDVLLDMCLQVCEGMAYLEGQKFIHRDLAARNCLVGTNNLIKVGDFGLARYVVDDEYTGSGGAKFPIKWAAPEVLNYMRFSSKSDVWAFAVLMWEVFTCGKMPYGRHKNAEVVEMVQLGKVLDRPRHCPPEIYEVMRKGWTHSQEQRPGFQEMRNDIVLIVKTITD